MFALTIRNNIPVVQCPFCPFSLPQTGQVQTLKQCNCSCAGWLGVRGLSRHGGQGPAVWWGLPAPLRAQHTHPIWSGADRTHPGALQLPWGLPYACWTPKPQGDHRRDHLAAGTPIPTGERRFIMRVGQGVPLSEEGRELVHATASHRHQEDWGLV